MEQVSATRTEMLTRRAQIRLAEQGAELLRSKRDALVREFLAELRRFVAARQAMRRSVLEAVQALMQTLAVDGQEAAAIDPDRQLLAWCLGDLPGVVDLAGSQ